MALQLPFPSLWATTADRDEYVQRLTLARRISGIRWLCILAGLVACRSHSFVSASVFVAVALYNVLPSFYASRSTLSQLRRFGKVLLALDGIALLFVSLPLVTWGEYPVPFILLFFAASIRLGYEPPRTSAVGMAATTIVGVGVGLLPLLRGDYMQDAFLWTLLCVFLGWRGALAAQARWRERQKLWAQPPAAPPQEMATENDAQSAVGAVGSSASAVGETQQLTNKVVCKSGYTTDETCSVTNIVHSTVNMSSAEETFTVQDMVGSRATTRIVDGGDSGGPVYVTVGDNTQITAEGITSAMNDEGRQMFYSFAGNIYPDMGIQILIT